MFNSIYKRQIIHIYVYMHGTNLLLKYLLIYPKNVIVVTQHNILKIFTMHFSKINQTLYFIAALLVNERDLHKIFQNTNVPQLSIFSG